MSLVFAAVTPHTPLLIPTIGKDQLQTMVKTKEAMEQLEKELYVARPQTIVIISPHSSIFPESFSLNAHTRMSTSFEKFGDLATKKEWLGSPDLAAKIGHLAKEREFPIQLVSQDRIDHGAAVPLMYLTDHLPDIRVLVIGYSALSPEYHIRFGNLLKDAFLETDKRVAVIASGDLSHEKKAPTNSPEPYRFDATLMQILTEQGIQKLKNMDDPVIVAGEECGYRSLLILLGILHDMKYTFKPYSYEHPFGVGYLAGQFIF